MTDWRDKFLNISWDTYRAQAFALAQKLEGKQFDVIVAIARGGLTLSQLLSDELSLPIASFTIQSYKNLKQHAEPVISFELGARLDHKKVLLVDDVSDTGKTFIRARKYLEELGAHVQNITTAALHYKPQSIYKPDYYIGETSKWIIHPYEVIETMTTLLPQWKKEGITIGEIEKRFLSFSISKEQIAKVLKKEFN